MTRSNLCLTGALLLTSGAIGWLWKDNQALREQAAQGAPQIAPEAAEADRAKVLQIADRKADAAPDRRSAPDSAIPRRPRARLDHGLQPVRAGKDPSPESGKRKEAGDPQASVADAGKEAAAANQDPRRLLVVVTAAEGEKNRASLFTNGGFEKGLDPWLCEEGRVVQEPGNPENSILEIKPREGQYRLSQDFQRSVSSPHQLLTFRLKMEGDCRIKVSLREKDGRTLPVHENLLFGKPDKWNDVCIPFDLSFQPVAMLIEGSSKTALSLDDVVLREVSRSLVGIK